MIPAVGIRVFAFLLVSDSCGACQGPLLALFRPRGFAGCYPGGRARRLAADLVGPVRLFLLAQALDGAFSDQRDQEFMNYYSDFALERR